MPRKDDKLNIFGLVTELENTTPEAEFENRFDKLFSASLKKYGFKVFSKVNKKFKFENGDLVFTESYPGDSYLIVRGKNIATIGDSSGIGTVEELLDIYGDDEILLVARKLWTEADLRDFRKGNYPPAPGYIKQANKALKQEADRKLLGKSVKENNSYGQVNSVQNNKQSKTKQRNSSMKTSATKKSQKTSKAKRSSSKSSSNNGNGKAKARQPRQFVTPAELKSFSKLGKSELKDLGIGKLKNYCRQLGGKPSKEEMDETQVIRFIIKNR